MKNQKAHFLKFFYFSLGSVIAMLASFLTTVVVNKNLEPEDLGKYSYYFVLGNFLFPVLSLSAYSAYLRFYHVVNSYELVGLVKKTCHYSTILLIVVLFVISQSLSVATFAFVIIFTEKLYLERASLNILNYNILNVGQKLLFLMLLLVALRLSGELKWEAVFLCLGFAYIITIAINFIFHSNIKKTNSGTHGLAEYKKPIRKYVVMATLTTGVTWFLLLSDQIIIKYFMGYESLAPYSVAHRMLMVVTIISGVFLSYYPTLYFREIENKKTDTIKIFRLLFFTAIILFTILFAFFKDFVYLLFGADKYSDFTQYFVLLLIGESFRLFGSVNFTYLTFKLKQNVILYTLIFVSILNVGLNIAFVPIYGVISAVYSTLLCYILYFILSLIFSVLPERRYFRSF